MSAPKMATGIEMMGEMVPLLIKIQHNLDDDLNLDQLAATFGY